MGFQNITKHVNSFYLWQWGFQWPITTMQYFGDLHDLIMTVVISTITRATRDGFEIGYLVEVCNLTRNTWYPNPAYVPITMEELEYVGGWNRWAYLMVWYLIWDIGFPSTARVMTITMMMEDLSYWKKPSVHALSK